MYQALPDRIIRLVDGAQIPLYPANADYAEYLAWLDEGNAPLPAVANSATEQRQALKARATQRRWEVETGGILLPNGARIATEMADQDRITATVAGMEAVGMATVDFKAESGWVTLTLDDVRAVRAAVAMHVQACFSAERAHHEAIDALADTALAGYDLDAGWPG